MKKTGAELRAGFLLFGKGQPQTSFTIFLYITT